MSLNDAVPRGHTHSRSTKVNFEEIFLPIVIVLGYTSNVLLVGAICVKRLANSIISAFVIHTCLLNVALITLCLLLRVGATACDGVGTAYIVLVTTSVMNVAALIAAELYDISDRYTAVLSGYTKPLNLSLSSSNRNCVAFGIAVAYTASIIIHLGPTIIGANFHSQNGCCYFIYNQGENYIIYVLWAVVSTFGYVACLCYLTTMYQHIRHYQEVCEEAGTKSTANNRLATQRNNSDALAVVQTKRNRAKVIGVVIIVRIVCWYPVFCLAIFDPSFSVASNVYHFLTILGWLNPAVEPLVFLFADQQYNIFWRVCRFSKHIGSGDTENGDEAIFVSSPWQKESKEVENMRVLSAEAMATYFTPNNIKMSTEV